MIYLFWNIAAAYLWQRRTNSFRPKNKRRWTLCNIPLVNDEMGKR